MARKDMGKDVIKAFLGDETEFKGVLSFEGTVRIDGLFEGEVITEDNLIIGETATVKAEIKVGAVIVQGYMEGNINASNKIQIASKGKLIGNITTPVLHIEEGAILEGNVSMLKKDEKKLRILPSKKDQQAEGKSASPANVTELQPDGSEPPAVKHINFE